MKDIVLIGAGGFAREITWLIEDNNLQKKEWNILGYVTDEDQIKLKYPILGNDKWLLKYDKEIYAVCCVGNSKLRRQIIEKFSSKQNIVFPNIISHKAFFSNSVNFGIGNIVCAGTILTVDIAVGNYCIMNLDCTIGHDAIIHDYVTLYPSVNISGMTEIGEDVELGTGTQIIQGKKIGNESIVGAGSVIIKDIPAKCTAVGSPAKPIKFFE